MSNFFKGFGRGLLYVLLFPFIIAGISLYAVFGLFVFIFQFIKLIVLFFGGRNLNSDLEEDIAAKAILAKDENEEPENSQNNQLSLYPSDFSTYSSEYSSQFTGNKENENIEEDDDHDL